MKSPASGSTLITSAPRSASSIVAYGPASMWLRSMMRTPASGPSARAPSLGGPSASEPSLRSEDPEESGILTPWKRGQHDGRAERQQCTSAEQSVRSHARDASLESVGDGPKGLAE